MEGGGEGGNSDQRIVFNSIKRHKFTVKLNNVYVDNHDAKAPYRSLQLLFAPKELLYSDIFCQIIAWKHRR